jgi:SAM-dependent methyltransferase
VDPSPSVGATSVRESLFEHDWSLRGKRLERLGPRQRLVHVAVLSGLGLFLELLFIRWLESQVRHLVYVKNLPLVASVLGLGLGYALAGRRRSFFPLAILLCAILLSVGVHLGDVGVTEHGVPNLFGPASLEANIPAQVATSTSQLLAFFATIVGIFSLTVLAMVPFGQIAGEYMEGLHALRAYSANVAGALLGIAVFSLLAYLSTPPWVLALLGLSVAAAYQQASTPLRICSVVGIMVVSGAMAATDSQPGQRIAWSPYNKIQVARLPTLVFADGRKVKLGWSLRSQNVYYQKLLDLRPTTLTAIGDIPWITQAASSYGYPYRARRPHRVLVLGAGTGNDVAAALRSGAERVDAVEIDPQIAAFGRSLHPERPYQDPRVHLHLGDARAFLKRTTDSYDTIVFGLLDAHLFAFSPLATSIRLDNYVYTVESFRQALTRLTPDGILSLAFFIEKPWIAVRIEAMLREASGHTPLVTPVGYDAGVLFITGPGASGLKDRLQMPEGLPRDFVSANPAGPLARDDWPFVYSRSRTLSATIVGGSAGMLLVCIALVLAFFRGQSHFDRHFFFLGAGFLLVETRTIAQLGLLFGATWQVSALTIGAILVLILAGNAVVMRHGTLRSLPLYAALGLCLVGNLLIRPAMVLGAGTLAAVGMAFFLALPLLFAALIFASSVRKSESRLAPLLASNLVGSVLGGVLENASMMIGISSLSLIALALYAASFRR